MFKKIARYIRLYFFSKKFRYLNRHNRVYPSNYFPIECVCVGKKTYGALKVVWMASNKTKLVIGNYCSIGPDVTFLVGGRHNYKRISLFPFQSLVFKQPSKDVINNDIIIEDDVWLGYNCLIMSGVRIGKGSVIGAKSVVTKDVPPYSVFVGNKVVKKRFSDDIIKKLMTIDYSTICIDSNSAYGEYCQTEITEENVDQIINIFCQKS